MRWVHMTIIVVFATATVIFAIQNREMVSMDFLSFSLRSPLAIMAAFFYVLGAITGSSLFALLRKSVAASRQSGPAAKA